jgi:hypothetical protein
MEGIIYSFLNASFLFFLYETEAFVEYIKLFRLNKFFEIDKYEEYLDSVGGGYWEYLTFESPTFLRKLVSCPLCVSFWLNLGCLSLYGSWVFLVINFWLTLFLYLSLKTLLKKSS